MYASTPDPEAAQHTIEGLNEEHVGFIKAQQMRKAHFQEAAWFYNHVRPHQNLKGLTPEEAWDGLSPQDLQRSPRVAAAKA